MVEDLETYKNRKYFEWLVRQVRDFSELENTGKFTTEEQERIKKEIDDYFEYIAPTHGLTGVQIKMFYACYIIARVQKIREIFDKKLERLGP